MRGKLKVYFGHAGVAAAKATIWFLAWRLEKGLKTLGCDPLRRLVRLKIAVSLASRNSFRTHVSPEPTLGYLAPQSSVIPSETSVWKSIREKNISAVRRQRKIDFLHAHTRNRFIDAHQSYPVLWVSFVSQLWESGRIVSFLWRVLFVKI